MSSFGLVKIVDSMLVITGHEKVKLSMTFICHRHISSSTSVTNIDVAKVSPLTKFDHTFCLVHDQNSGNCYCFKHLVPVLFDASKTRGEIF